MMEKDRFDQGPIDIAWCPGCGNFAILTALKRALNAIGMRPEGLVVVSGIGQAAKIPHYLRTNFFNGLHGRALPAATAIKAANPSLMVMAESGDGDMYGEGGNHFIHAIRRNPDITHVVHNNMVYGLTKGQASPTSLRDFRTPLQASGVAAEPFNPLAAAVALGAGFAARTFAGDIPGTAAILERAFRHRGYALVDIFQPCVTFNKLNTFAWFREHTYGLGEEHDPADREAAFRLAMETERYPLGVIFERSGAPTFEETLAAYRDRREPLFRREVDWDRWRAVVASHRGA